MNGIVMAERPTLFRLENPIRRYAWGSHEWLAQIRGMASPTLEPEAELWIGAHDADPSLVLNEGPLNRLISDDPEHFLGSLVRKKFGQGLPFLLKVLAVAQPLSLQVHPTLEQAKAGYLEESEAGLSIHSNRRTFVDGNHKPELLVAVSDFYALVGFRAIDEIVSLVESLVTEGATGLATRILEPLEISPTDQGLRDVIKSLVGQPDEISLVEEVVGAAKKIESGKGRYAESAHWFIKIAQLFPTRPDVVATLLLNLVHLTPGDAIYVAPGQIHSYLGGLGIEIMSSSDNVVRGGLTPKHVDVPSFLSMVDWTPGVIHRIEGIAVDAITTWTPPTDDFVLSRIDCLGELDNLKVKAPLVLFALSNSAVISRGSEEIEIKQGDSVFVVPGSPIAISGVSTLWCGSCRIS